MLLPPFIFHAAAVKTVVADLSQYKSINMGGKPYVPDKIVLISIDSG